MTLLFPFCLSYLTVAATAEFCARCKEVRVRWQ